jgi:uncharacterized lipoprotein YehR (DUF1307 family)
MMKRYSVGLLAALVLLTALTACQSQHKVETVHKVEVAPMHITIDINLKVDKALDDFFGDLDDAEGGEPSQEK